MQIWYCSAKLLPEGELQMMIDFINGISEDLSVVCDICSEMEANWKEDIIPFIEGIYDKYNHEKVSFCHCIICPQ